MRRRSRRREAGIADACGNTERFAGRRTLDRGTERFAGRRTLDRGAERFAAAVIDICGKGGIS